MSQDPESDLNDLSRLVHQDQSIAGRVLRIANSAAFAPVERIVSLQQAVSRLGLQLLSEIALSVAVQANVFHSIKYKTQIAIMWKHALASAIFGKEIARFMRRNVEGQYLCGLLHTIGKPVVLKTIESFEQQNKADIEIEKVMEMVEHYHIPVGDFVTRKWNLPKSVQMASRFYQKYSDTPEFKMETAITHLADKLASVIIIETENPERDMIYDPVFEVLNIYPADRNAIFEKIPEVRELTAAINL